MTVPVAIVGCGLIGRKRAESFRAAGLGRVVALFDVDRARAEALDRALGLGATICGSTAEAAGLAAGGLAVIATIHDSLANEAITAIAAGCHVLVEKPGGRSAAEATAIRDAAGSAGVSARVGFNHRFHPSFLALHELLADTARHGEVMVVRARYGHGGRIGYDQEWRASRERSGGGELLDQGVHLLDLTRFLAGGLELAYAALPTHYWNMEVEDNAFVHARLANGGDAWLHASWTEWKNLFDFEVFTRTTKFEVSGLGGSYGPERLVVHEMPPELGPPLITTTEWPPGDTSWAAEAADVLAAIAGSPALGASIDDTIATLSLIDEAYAR